MSALRTTTKDALEQLVLGAAGPVDLQVNGALGVGHGDVTRLTQVFVSVEPFTFWVNIVAP